MRNFRKTRKRGGFNYTDNIYNCGVNITKKGEIKKVPVEKCAKNFADENDFLIVKTADDGNCFYDTLSKYGSRTGNPKTNKTHMELRQEIVGSILKPEKLNEIAPFLVEDRTVSPEKNAIEVNPVEELKKFLKEYEWAGWMGDVIPQIAAEVLGVNITIYDVIDNMNDVILNMNDVIPNMNDVIPNRIIPNKIVRIEFSGGRNINTTIFMLRTNGNHFRLLWPKDAPVLPRGRKIKANALVNLTAKVNRVALANRPAEGGPGRAPSRAPSPKRPARKTKKNIEAEEAMALQAALEASLENQLKASKNKLPNSFYNTFESTF